MIIDSTNVISVITSVNFLIRDRSPRVVSDIVAMARDPTSGNRNRVSSIIIIVSPLDSRKPYFIGSPSYGENQIGKVGL